MKNFKKVISAVVALAMSVSSLVAVNASSFSDIADTAAYAEAVDVLSAMGIVTGYGDGTFKPEGEITRAEAATMIVGALNMTEEAKASEGTSQFADVNTSAAWASGYINVGVGQGFIKGMDANTFAPQENVTYAQMCVMLTTVAGYGEYAAANNNTGDWSYGYTTMAQSTGINKGVNVSKDTKLTRAQVAQMIYNTLLTPMLDVSEYSLTGNTYAQLDGKGNRAFKTLLSDKFDGYQVTATVTATASSNDTLDNGEAKIDITKADWWDDAPISKADDKNGKDLTVKVGAAVDANAALLQSGKAIIIIDDDDDANLIYFSANAKVETKEFDAADFVKNSKLGAANKFGTNGKLRFGTKYYTMADEIDLYVNGVNTKTVKVPAEDATDAVKKTANDDIDNYLGNAVGTIKMVKGSGDKGYSSVFVTVYEVAEVTAVTYKSNKTTINMTTMTTQAVGSKKGIKLVVDDDKVEDGDVVINVTKNGNKIALKDIAVDDIVAFSMAFPVTNSTITNPKEITVLVTNDTLTGKVSSKNTDDNKYTIDGKEYKCTDWSAVSMDVKNTYTMRLDPFGKIFDADEDSSSKAFAILERVANEKVTLVLADGSVKSYEASGSVQSTADGILYEADGKTKKSPEERVVEYTVKNSTGALSSVKAVKATNVNENDDTDLSNVKDIEYKAARGKLGSVSVNAATKYIDYSKYDGSSSDYKTMTLNDGAKYTAYAFKADGTTNATLVLVEKAGNAFTATTRFAVVKKAPQKADYNDEECYEVQVMMNGDVDTVYLADPYTLKIKTTDAKKQILSVGDVFVYKTDSDGFISDVYVVYDYSENAFATFADLSVPTSDYSTDKDDDDAWSFNLYDAKDNVAIVDGYVAQVNGKNISFANVANTTTTKQIDTTIEDKKATDNGEYKGIYTYRLADKAEVYVFDTTDDNATNNSGRIGTGAVIASGLTSYFETGDNTGIYNTVLYEKDKDGNDTAKIADTMTLHYAVALLVDGEIQQIYEIQY